MQHSLSELEDWISDHPLGALAVTLGAVVLIGLVGFFIVRLTSSTETKKPAVTRVTFNDGANEIVVERSGRVTIKTPYGTFTQTWDPEKVRRFFEGLEDMDFDQLTKFIGTSLAVQLTMSSGETVTIAIEEVSPEVAQTLQTALEEVYKDNSLLPKTTTGSLLTSPTPRPTPIPSLTPTPTPYSRPVSTTVPTGSLNPWYSSPDSEETGSFLCEEIDPRTGKKTIISNTVCAR